MVLEVGQVDLLDHVVLISGGEGRQGRLVVAEPGGQVEPIHRDQEGHLLGSLLLNVGQWLCGYFVFFHAKVVLPIFGHDYLLARLLLVLVLDVLDGLALLGDLFLHCHELLIYGGVIK